MLVSPFAVLPKKHIRLTIKVFPPHCRIRHGNRIGVLEQEASCKFAVAVARNRQTIMHPTNQTRPTAAPSTHKHTSTLTLKSTQKIIETHMQTRRQL